MKKAIFKKSFSDYSANKGFLSNLLNKDGYNKEKIRQQLNFINKGFDGERQLNYYLENTFKEIYCLHNVRIKNGKHKAQLDFVVIARDCIWVLESKSLSGLTTVNEDGKCMRETGGCTKYPLIQAEIQANNLKEFLLNKNLITEDIEVKYKVVFTDKSQKSNVNYSNDEIKKYFIDVELISTIFEDDAEERLSIESIDMISECLIKETGIVRETPINDSDYLLPVKEYKQTYNKNKYNCMSKSNTSSNQVKNETKTVKNKKKKKSNIIPLLMTICIMGVIWFKFISPIYDQTINILEIPSEELSTILPSEENIKEETPEEKALGNQRFVTKKLPQSVATSQSVDQTSEVLLIAKDMGKEELITLLKNNYSNNYDYAKVTITTSKVLFDYYSTITFSKPDNLEKLEQENLIGYYTKNSCFKNIEGYQKDRIKFVQNTGNFSNLYNQYVNVK